MRIAKTTEQAPIYQLKITLRESKPPIWRRIQVPGDVLLSKLHRILQMTMGWTDSHLHQFTIGGQDYSDPDSELEDTANEKKFKLNTVINTEKAKFHYLYDFGDDWEHEILVEKILPPAPGVHYPVCIKGARACPFEDSGGMWGYMNLLNILGDPTHEEHEEMLEWTGGPIDPEEFDMEQLNADLRRLR